MRPKQVNAGRNPGFTLIELLAVIAIIGILASIVVPNVVRYIARSQVAKAVSEIRNVDTALIGALSDTGRSNFREFLNQAAIQKLKDWSEDIDTNTGTVNAITKAGEFYNEFFYELLRQGRESEFIEENVIPAVRQKLGTSYMDLGKDSWGNQYQFWMGPLRRGPMILRSYRVRTDDQVVNEVDDPEFSNLDAYIYTQARRIQAQLELPGQPKKDDDVIRNAFDQTFPPIEAYGYPAPKDLPVYVWSVGPNLESDAHLLIQMDRGADQSSPEFLGGGDDPNNWDNESGWEDAPR